MTSVLCSITMLTFLAGPSDHETMRAALTFHASFDGKSDADFARGDKRIHTASGENRKETKVGLGYRPDVTIAAGKGRFGDALHFGKKDKAVVYFPADKNMAYRTKDWSGTISFWMKLDPNKDLEPGFCDPIQITEKQYDDAAFFVDFTKDSPRRFRLGVFADRTVWNPKMLKDVPRPQRPFSEEVMNPPFARDKWTHVAITFSSFNTGKKDGDARLYLDAQHRASVKDREHTFTWDTSKAAIMLGLFYIGLYDDLALFDRAFTEAEVQALYRLEGGVSSLRK